MTTLWAFYFLATSYLHFRGLMRLHVVYNLILMGLVLWPIHRDHGRHKALSAGRTAATLALGCFLLWRDSLPLRLAPERFELIEGAVLVALLAACEFSSRRGFRPMTMAVVLFLAVAVQDLGAASQAIALHVNDFYASESARVVRFLRPAPAPAFDVVFLHVGSLSWDDLIVADRLRHPLLDRFDYLLTNFNSVSSYTGPSSLRLLRAPCGQVSHEDLYKPWPKECSLLDALRGKDYRAFTVFNHADKDGTMAKDLRERAQAEAPMGIEGLSTKLINYDGTPLAGDFDALKRWWQTRQQSGAARAFLYYNTATLQAGAHEPWPAWWRESRVSRYRRRLDVVARDLDQFFALLDASGRNVVVFLIPEHGGSLREGPFPREVPTPQFTHVPVGIKLIGKGRGAASFKQNVNRASTSYLAIAQILASYLQTPPFGERAAGKSDEAMARLPSIDFLAENEAARYLRIGEDSFVFEKERKWIKLRPKTVKIEAAELVRLRP